MTGRQRFLMALNHQEPDKIPIDFGATTASGISASMIYKLRRAYNLPEHPIKIIDSFQMLGEIEEDLREKLNSDCVMVKPYTSTFGFRNDNWKSWTHFDGTPVLVPGDFNTVVNAQGGIYQYPQGDKSVPPSGLMPKDGYYFDILTRQDPAFSADKPVLEDNLVEFTPLSDEALKYYQKEAEYLRKNTGCAVSAAPGGTALGNYSGITAPFLKHPKGLRDFEEWCVFLLTQQDFIKELFDHQTQVAIKNLALFQEAVGSNIDILFLCGTDLGTQNGPLFSVTVFNELYLPYYKRMTEWIHKNTSWKVFKHCCGSIKPLLKPLIEAGFDIINPIQNSARDMDPQILKDEYGDKITFWGGGVDTQHTLPFGRPEEVFQQVTQRIKIYNKNGGYVFNTIHNVQTGIPVENFMAMMEALKQFR